MMPLKFYNLNLIGRPGVSSAWVCSLLVKVELIILVSMVFEAPYVVKIVTMGNAVLLIIFNIDEGSFDALLVRAQ